MFGSRRQDQDRIDALQRRVRELEALVRELGTRAGMSDGDASRLAADLDGGITPRVRELVAEHRVIEAIKEYRSATGAGLKEAKDAVDAYRSRHPGT